MKSLTEKAALFDELVVALTDLEFTASYLWDQAKPIKDGPCVTVTHPIIENARDLLSRCAAVEKDNV